MSTLGETFFDNILLWLWVPAFAGTTPEMTSAQPNLNEFVDRSDIAAPRGVFEDFPLWP